MKKEYDFPRSQLEAGNAYKYLSSPSTINKIVNSHLNSQENLGSEEKLKYIKLIPLSHLQIQTNDYKQFQSSSFHFKNNHLRRSKK